VVSAPAIGVLAIQGDFGLHLDSLRRIGIEGRKVRLPGDLDGLDGLIIPGGESTTMAKLARDYGLTDEMRRAGEGGMAMFGTCAGAILLGRGDGEPERLGLVPVTVRRNAYGRQRESFERPIPLRIDGPGAPPREFTCVFIRAPKIDPPGDPSVEILGKDGDHPILLRRGRLLLATFHPELTDDPSIHRLFVSLVGA
jgi:5'-phosphate synthase pdxT subunit